LHRSGAKTFTQKIAHCTTERSALSPPRYGFLGRKARNFFFFCGKKNDDSRRVKRVQLHDETPREAYNVEMFDTKQLDLTPFDPFAS
jgi:hypothetical protein